MSKAKNKMLVLANYPQKQQIPHPPNCRNPASVSNLLETDSKSDLLSIICFLYHLNIARFIRVIFAAGQSNAEPVRSQHIGPQTLFICGTLLLTIILC